MEFGSKVKLKSDGPDMIILKITGDQVLCAWDFDGSLCMEIFNIKTLEICD